MSFRQDPRTARLTIEAARKKREKDTGELRAKAREEFLNAKRRAPQTENAIAIAPEDIPAAVCYIHYSNFQINLKYAFI